MIAMAPSASLRKINGDTTWLLQVPQPGSPSEYFNLLIDPWLATSRQVDYHPLFSAQTRTETALHPTLSSLSQALSQYSLEAVAESKRRTSQEVVQLTDSAHGSAQIDAILVSHPFSDHAHPETLQNFPATSRPVQIFGPRPTQRTLRRLFSDVDRAKAASQSPVIHELHAMALTDSLQQVFASGQAGLPAHIRILHLPARESWRNGPAWGEVHSATAILWRTAQGAGSDDHFHSIVYSPHGCLQTSIPPSLSKAHVRVLMQSFDRQIVPFLTLVTGPVALGYRSISTCYPNVDGDHGDGLYAPTLILRTHDEHKDAAGLIARVIAREETTTDSVKEHLKSAFSLLPATLHPAVKELASGDLIALR
ncbi:unnamed protein product [Parajaminaea phylloscopi]